jgi:hypothetical protein
MVRSIDWEDRCWQLSHDMAVRLVIEAKDNGTDPVVAAGEAVHIAATLCEVYRGAVDLVEGKGEGQT